VPELQPLLPLLERAIGERPSPLKVWRWVNKGIKVNGRRVKLDAKKVGGRFYASPDTVTEFIDAQNPPADHDDAVDDSAGRSEAMERRLQSAGLL